MPTITESFNENYDAGRHVSEAHVGRQISGFAIRTYLPSLKSI